MREIKFRAWDGKQMLSNHEINGDWLLANKYEHTKPMQFTGLRDKNGKEIYEADILKYGDGKVFENHSIGLIVFEGAGFVFKSPMNNFYLGVENTRSFEIIGNVYEHPGLIRKELMGSLSEY